MKYISKDNRGKCRRFKEATETKWYHRKGNYQKEGPSILGFSACGLSANQRNVRALISCLWCSISLCNSPTLREKQAESNFHLPEGKLKRSTEIIKTMHLALWRRHLSQHADTSDESANSLVPERKWKRTALQKCYLITAWWLNGYFYI